MICLKDKALTPAEEHELRQWACYDQSWAMRLEEAMLARKLSAARKKREAMVQ